jgi:hypothetical protein
MTNRERLLQVCRVCGLDYDEYAPSFTKCCDLNLVSKRTLRAFVFYDMGRPGVPLGLRFWEDVAGHMYTHGTDSEADLRLAYRRVRTCLI